MIYKPGDIFYLNNSTWLHYLLRKGNIDYDSKYITATKQWYFAVNKIKYLSYLPNFIHTDIFREPNSLSGEILERIYD